MNKHLFTFVLFLLGGLSAAQAQNNRDSLFLHQIPVSNPKIIEGKAYYFETVEQHSLRKSRLFNENDTPLFDRSENPTNGIPYAEFGNKPIVFNNVKTGTVKVGEENRLCFILSFTCDKKTFFAYNFRESLLRSSYNLIEADFFNQLNKLLVGQTLYTRSANWLNYNEDKLNSNLKTEPVREGTCKYCPVTVTRVENDYDDNYLVLFKQNTQGNEYAFGNVEFEKDNRSSFNFLRYFTFTNPQETYPDISQERWEQIMAQNVRKGFTPDEVMTAYGKADEIYTEDDDETWVYINRNKKDYAITFKDGIVEKVVSQTSRYY
jgi:hypothetical protein